MIDSYIYLNYKNAYICDRMRIRRCYVMIKEFSVILCKKKKKVLIASLLFLMMAGLTACNTKNDEVVNPVQSTNTYPTHHPDPHH